jgi:hypothetical protein
MAPRIFFLREYSLHLDRFEPLTKDGTKKTALILDRFIAYRAAAGDSISRKELVLPIKASPARQLLRALLYLLRLTSRDGGNAGDCREQSLP